jgi:hypothetical protein
MNKRLAFIAIVFGLVLAAAAQLKPLVVARTIPTTIKFEGHRSFALPSFCDEKEKSYIRLLEPGMGMAGPVFRLSKQGFVEAKFDTTDTLENTFAVRPNGGIAAARIDGKTKVIVNFGPDGEREEEVRLETPPIPFFPMQIAIFPSGGILISGGSYRENQASTAVYDPEGHLIKQIVLEGDEELEHAIPSSDKKSSHSPVIDRSSISRSVAITGDDGNVYLMRATAPPTVYAISPTGEVLHKIVVPSPPDAAWPRFGIRVIKNKLVVEFYRECSNRLDSGSCKGTVLSVLEASTGKPLVNYEPEETAGSVIACYVPDPDRFFMFQDAPNGTAIMVVESVPK